MTGTDPLFLVGPQRSGTTALAGALSNAVAAAGGCFTANGKLPYLLRRWWTQDDIAAGHLRADEVTHALTRVPPYGAGSEPWLDRARTALLASARRAATGGEPPTVVDDIRAICAEAYGNTGLWGDKYNEYLLELPWLHSVFPDARWAFLVRDPDATVSSMLNWRRDKPWNPADAHAASAKWAHWTSRWLAFRDAVPPDRRVELDYADLCAGDHTALAKFTGLDLDAELAGFRSRPAAHRERPRLCREALSVRAELTRLKILGGST
ncbi:hypothetical protein OK074_4535 [Actinobacteria bacterium OK074]|nr:hypothetical protein OK074_4535 [Actinobacteria bacterium OK074]